VQANPLDIGISESCCILVSLQLFGRHFASIFDANQHDDKYNYRAEKPLVHLLYTLNKLMLKP
jgi:hypothetical protein